MKTNLLSSDKDPMGTAIADYFNHNKADKLRVFSSQFEEDEIPVNQLFRPYDEMPELEQIALQMAEGNILDVGAGAAAMHWPCKRWEKRYAPSTFPPVL
mgnify:CR=1 FL=1